jgi:hypothetical protein
MRRFQIDGGMDDENDTLTKKTHTKFRIANQLWNWMDGAAVDKD